MKLWVNISHSLWATGLGSSKLFFPGKALLPHVHANLPLPDALCPSLSIPSQ